MSAGSDPATTVQLLERAKAGNQSAVNDLLRRCLPRLRRWARGRLPAGARGMLETEDVVLETVVKAFEKLDRLNVGEDGALQAYLRGALAHRFIDLYRQAARRPLAAELPSEMPAASPSPLEMLIGAEALDRYEAALDALASTDRQAIVLRVELCWGYDEIATAMRKNGASQARVAVSRALDRLARKMGHVRQ